MGNFYKKMLKWKYSLHHLVLQGRVLKISSIKQCSPAYNQICLCCILLNIENSHKILTDNSSTRKNFSYAVITVYVDRRIHVVINQFIFKMWLVYYDHVIFEIMCNTKALLHTKKTNSLIFIIIWQSTTKTWKEII